MCKDKFNNLTTKKRPSVGTYEISALTKKPEYIKYEKFSKDRICRFDRVNAYVDYKDLVAIKSLPNFKFTGLQELLDKHKFNKCKPNKSLLFYFDEDNKKVLLGRKNGQSDAMSLTAFLPPVTNYYSRQLRISCLEK